MEGSEIPEAVPIHGFALQVLQHRVLTNFKARAEGVDTSTLLKEIIQSAT